MSMFEGIYRDVADLLDADHSGHGMDHVDRVRELSVEFALEEGADIAVVELTALVHDADDYKLFGQKSADNLTHATDILRRNGVGKKLANHVLGIIPNMGYNNFLDGKRPTSLEGKVVSDADMADAIGSQGLIRVFEYNRVKGRPFFIPSITPVPFTGDVEAYRAQGNEHAVQHFFDKLLKIPDIMLTDAGRAEAQKRTKIMEDFLVELFREERATVWQAHLEAFLSKKS